MIKSLSATQCFFMVRNDTNFWICQIGIWEGSRNLHEILRPNSSSSRRDLHLIVYFQVIRSIWYNAFEDIRKRRKRSFFIPEKNRSVMCSEKWCRKKLRIGNRSRILESFLRRYLGRIRRTLIIIYVIIFE